MQPAHTVLRELLDPWLELRLVQLKIVHCSDSQDALGRETTAAAIHERTANRAEGIFHNVARIDGLALCPARELVFAPHVVEGGIVDDEVGCEH